MAWKRNIKYGLCLKGDKLDNSNTLLKNNNVENQMQIVWQAIYAIGIEVQKWAWLKQYSKWNTINWKGVKTRASRRLAEQPKHLPDPQDEYFHFSHYVTLLRCEETLLLIIISKNRLPYYQYSYSQGREGRRKRQNVCVCVYVCVCVSLGLDKQKQYTETHIPNLKAT